MDDNSPTSFAEAEQAFRELLEQSQLPEPDEVVRQRDPDELVFIWHAPQYAVVVELEPQLRDFQVANERLV